MARRKQNPGQETNIIALAVPVGSDLQLRLKKISKQTGLSQFNLVQKWILQEESMIGLLSLGKKQTTVKAEEKEKAASPVVRKTRRKASPVKVQEETGTGKPEGSDRVKLADRAKKLKSEGWTLKKIADAFNGEKISTISGTGKWYTSSITWLLKSSK